MSASFTSALGKTILECGMEANVRALRSLLQLTALINDRELPMEALVRRVAALLPQAYQYPEIARVRIECDGFVVESQGYRETDWEQTATISTLDSRIGFLRVCYLEPRPVEAEGPFLEEERDLINTLGELLGERIERARIEEALRNKEEHLAMVLRSTPIILWAADRDGIISLARGRSLAGPDLQPEQLAGRSIHSLMAPSAQFGDYFARVLAGEEVDADLELQGFSFRCRLTPIRGGEGAVTGVIGVLLDITKRVTAERELLKTTVLLKEVFSGTHFLIASLDRDLRYRRVNKAFAQANGREPEFYIGKRHFDLFPDAAMEPIFRRVLETREVFSAHDIELKSLGPGEVSNWDIDLHPLGTEGLVLILVDRSKRKRALAELESSRQELRRLASHLQDLREEERRYIAREIHDELGGLLTAIKMDLSMVKQGSAAAIKRADGVVNQAIALVRRIAYDLRPQVLDDLGLVSAIEWLISEFRQRTRIRCKLRAPDEEITLPKDMATALFRIVQEALTNVARHAQASRVTIVLGLKDGDIGLEVADDGKGITETQVASAESFGMIGIRERVSHFGGSVQIRGEPRQGTLLAVTIPLRRGET